jgi:O-antigen/teichoic acid export membrane protein
VFGTDAAKKIFSNTTYQVIGKVVSLLITVFGTIIITRQYGRQGYGEFSLMQNYPALLFIIADFGLNAIAVRELSSNWERAKKYFPNILFMRIILSLFLMFTLGIVISLSPYSESLKLGIHLGLFLILTQALYATTNVIFQSKLRYDYSAIGYVIGYGVILVLVLLLSYFKVSIMWVNFSYVVGGFITFFVNLAFIKKLGIDFSFSLDKKLIKYLFMQALPLGLMFVFSQINFKADSIALSLLPVPKGYGLTKTEAVAVYNLPYKIFEVSLVVPAFFMNSAYPVLVKHMRVGKEKLKTTFSHVLQALFVGGIAVSILGFLFAPLVISILGGDAFSQSVTVLRILILGVVIFYLTQPISWLVVTLGKQKYLPWIYLFSAFFDVGANIIFIPKYSFYGSSIITIVAELFVLLLLIFAALKAWRAKYAT